MYAVHAQAGPVCRCVLGDTPRALAPEDANTMTNLAELAVRQLEKDHLLELQRLVGHQPDQSRLGMHTHTCTRDPILWLQRTNAITMPG